MPIDCKMEQEQMRLLLTGEIDHHRAGVLMRQLEEQLDLESPSRVELDMGGVTFMDSSGIALLLKVYRTLALNGGRLTVVRVPAQAGKVLRAAGLQRLFSITYL